MREIPVKNGDTYVPTLVDEEDYQSVAPFKWRLISGYAARSFRLSGKRGTMFMHRHIFGLVNGDKISVDHINRVKLDNRRCNLRKCSSSENNQNKFKFKNNNSGYKGVYLQTIGKKYIAQIGVDKKIIYLGSFRNVIEAAKKYDKAARLYFGELAFVNFPNIK